MDADMPNSYFFCHKLIIWNFIDTCEEKVHEIVINCVIG